MSDFSDLERPILGVPRMQKGQHTKYVPNHSSFGLFIKSDQVRDPTVEAAQDIAASAASKVGPGGGDNSRGLHGRVRKGYKVRRNAGLMKVSGNLRVEVEIFNNAEGAALVEFGARNIKRDRPLGRAGAEFGDFKPEGGPG